MPQMFFLTGIKNTTTQTTQTAKKNPPQNTTYSLSNSKNRVGYDMMHAIRTGSTNCKACGRG